jgi:hypothetical protein
MKSKMSFDNKAMNPTFTRHYSKQSINDQFDRQIRLAQLNKELFNHTFEFTTKDWRTIRTEKYWATVSGKSELERMEYTLQCVLHYKKMSKNV